jgi:dimeric dUTPase (all-alpha-NTP-PPase superfamily)
MDLSKLFQLQRQLDERIEREHPRQEGEDRLAKKILALQVELGELCNCWRGFKYWSHDQEPKTYVQIGCEKCVGGLTYCEECIRNPLLEEYVDGLHFLLSIGIDLGFRHFTPRLVKLHDTLKMFSSVFYCINQFEYVCGRYNKRSAYCELFSVYIGLGKKLGFTWEQIEEAYLRKNAVNHQRQESGY